MTFKLFCCILRVCREQDSLVSSTLLSELKYLNGTDGENVSLSVQGGADGELYLDDGHSFCFRDRKAFSLRGFSMQAGRLLCR